MPAKEVTALYQSILDSVTNKAYLKRAQFSKKMLLQFLQEAGFKAKLSALITAGRITGADVLELCAYVMDMLADEPKAGWLPFIYDMLVGRMYPAANGIGELSLALWRASYFYLVVFRAVLTYAQGYTAFDMNANFQFATEQELTESPSQQQYERFRNLMDFHFVVELMHIGRSVKPFDMLGHVAGVHHIATHMARQIKKAGVAVDIPLVSAAAATHDLGKYGCHGEEMQRIPYLHYYYTEELLSRYDMDAVAHIAANHSTWDLELENLSVESLLLIYADFRAKSVWQNGREEARIYTLQDSYDVILGKLDNVDDAKRKRYERVYAKLKDFEEYLVALGINPDPCSDAPLPVYDIDTAFLHSDLAVQAIKFKAIEHNLRLMHKISSDTSFADLLENARSEKNWKNLRAYIDIFEEYFTYMTQKQKQLTMRFLYELFMHSQGDIRSQAGALFGRILAGYDLVYRKEFPKNIAPLPLPDVTSYKLWQEALVDMLLPDHKLAPLHRTWINYSLKAVLPALIESCKEMDRQEFLCAYLSCFTNELYDDRFLDFVLLDSIINLERDLFADVELQAPLSVAKRLAANSESKNQAIALRFLLWVLEENESAADAVWDIIRVLPEKRQIGIEYLLLQLYERLEGAAIEQEQCEQKLRDADIGYLFLDNLKTATPWVIKEVNIQFLMYRTTLNGASYAFQVATHLVNLIRVSERFAVRHHAGQALVRMAEMLTLDQRNEIAVELTRGMESASDEFSKYIPQYLGRFVLYLHPKEFDEVLEEFEKYVKASGERPACIVLPTLGMILKYYNTSYQHRFGEEEDAFLERMRRMLGMLLGGLAHYNETIAREAFLVIGKQVFGGDLKFERKYELFGLRYKKLLLLMEAQSESTLTFFNHAASLNHIYRFIIDTKIRLGTMEFAAKNKVAFFPGTFDPFSSSHKAIVHKIQQNDFEVYLALDEFSWSKRTQPHMIRRHIVNMSVADMFDVYLFPDDNPINIANPGDLRQLRELYPGKEVYIAVGSDVIRNASAYKKPVEEYSIHSLGHIVFLRNMQDEAWLRERDAMFSRLQGNVLELELPQYFEDVSSTRIRDNIDHNRDISTLVDPVAQGFIYDNGLYLREPQYKELMRPEAMYFKKFSPDDKAMRERLIELAMRYNAQSGQPVENTQLLEKINAKLERPKAQLIALYNDSGALPIGMGCYYATNAAYLFDEFQNIRLAEYVRRHTSGRIAVIAGLYAPQSEVRYDVMRLMITEMLAECLREDYTYAMYIGAEGLRDESFSDILMRRGFLELPEFVQNEPVYAVDMRTPIALIEDVQERIKAPLSQDKEVLRTLRKAHQDFTIAMTKLYPGKLVLSFHAGLLNHALIDKILHANKVAHIPPEARQLGECMCVPYGKVLRGVIVPNTVTKALHVDKAYMPDMKSFRITKYPGYSTLKNQIRTIRSFNRPVLLVDDLLHKGYRLEALDPLFKEAELNIRQIIVGIMTGRGKDLMSVQDRQVESVYFIPNLRYWFVDSMLYPFLGGDTVQRPGAQSSYLLPSVNQIFPYTSPMFISGTSKDSLFELSLTCLNNARDILRTLERRHQEMFGYNLTLNRLGQASITARVPDKGGCMRYDRTLSPSVYVENDIEMLMRLEFMLTDRERIDKLK